MKLESKVADKINELLQKADAHPIMQKILAEKAAAIQTKRQDAAGEIEILTKERDEVIPKLRADLAGKETNFQKAKADLDAATSEYNAAKYALLNESNGFENRIKNQEAILYESADPLIDEAITFFNEKLSFLRSPGRISRSAGGAETNLFTLTKTVTESSNADAVRSALVYCQAALQKLERMKLTPILDKEKIERMKAGIPSIDVFTEITGEKPLPGVNADPLAGLPSDSELSWKTGKLTEKFKKVMRK